MATRLHRIPDPESAGTEAARAYDAVGNFYLAYADGDAQGLFDFGGRYDFADRQIWERLDVELQRLRIAGRREVRILDAGCGPGTWLRRIIARAADLGFERIVARGFDISPEMIAIALQDRRAVPKGCDLSLELGDIAAPLPEADASVDICLCLYGVLNHLPPGQHAAIAAELARVTGGCLFLTVRTVGSLPTIYVDRLDRARAYRQDNDADRMELDLIDGRHLSFTSHLFASAELRALFRPHARVDALIGLDLFHSRFATDPHWNPADLPYAQAFAAALAQMEQDCAADPAFIDRAAHILMIADCAA